MVNTIANGTMSVMGTIITTIAITGMDMATRMVPSLLHGNQDSGLSMNHIEDIMNKMIKIFDSIDDNVKDA